MDKEKNDVLEEQQTTQGGKTTAAHKKEKSRQTPLDDKKDKKKKETAEPAGEKDPKDAELDRLREEVAGLTDKLLRTAAEYDNYRKRTEREKTACIGYGTSGAVEKLLPVLDTLERAAVAESGDAEYKKGVLMTLDGFKSALNALGIEEIPAEGQPFDPELHCAVTRDTNSGRQSGTVVSVIQKGYIMGDRVVRHAMVTVAE